MALLQTHKLTVSFGGLQAVKDLDFNLDQGQITALIGPNGAGKTTTFNAICGFERNTRGQVFFRGHRISDLMPHQIARRGLVRTFQHTSIFQGITVLQAVMIGGNQNLETRWWDVLLHTRRFWAQEEGLFRWAEGIIEFTGLTARRDELGLNLSYGEQRLLEIAIALAGRPLLLLLDEPAAGLNPAETGKLKKLMLKIKAAGTTILLVEHDMSLVTNISDHIVVLNHGEKIAEGSPSEVTSNEEVIKAYLGGGGYAEAD